MLCFIRFHCSIGIVSKNVFSDKETEGIRLNGVISYFKRKILNFVSNQARFLQNQALSYFLPSSKNNSYHDCIALIDDKYRIQHFLVKNFQHKNLLFLFYLCSFQIQLYVFCECYPCFL